MQQIPEEIERLMVGIQAYLSIRRRLSDIGLAVFEDMEKIDKLHNEQVCFICSQCYKLLCYVLPVTPFCFL